MAQTLLIILVFSTTSKHSDNIGSPRKMVIGAALSVVIHPELLLDHLSKAILTRTTADKCLNYQWWF
jgi:hypothetical protein